MHLSMAVAYGPNREIGFQNKLLWHISDELKHFKKLTLNKSVLMGRKTFESIGRPLPNRQNIVLSRDESLIIPGVEVINDPLMAFECVLDYKKDEDEETEIEENELVIIGGEEIYKIYLPYVQKIYVSKVDYKGPADAYFPELDPLVWKESESTSFDQFTAVIYERVGE